QVNGETPTSAFKTRMWRRREIENYLMLPAAIARAAGVREEQVVDRLRSQHALVMPPNFTSSHVATALAEAHGKHIINDMQAQFGCSAINIAGSMRQGEVCEDVRTAIRQICDLCRSADHTDEEIRLPAPELLVSR